MEQGHPKYNADFVKLRGAAPAGDGAFESFTCSDGTRLHLQYWLPDGGAPQRAALCMHGMGGHGWYYSLLADVLVPAGIAVYVPDFRHHGLSDGAKGDMTDAFRIVSDMKQVAGSIRARHPGVKLFTLGESMGGAVNINFNIDYPGASDGMILVSPGIKPAMKFSARDIAMTPYYLLMLLVAQSRRVIVTKGEEHRAIRNPLHIRYNRHDPLIQERISPRFLLAVKRLVDIGAQEGPAAITTPALVIQGGRDVAVSPQGARDFFDALASPDKTFKYYPEGLHNLATDPDCADVNHIIRDWIIAH